MKDVATLLGFVTSTLQLSSLCRQVNILEIATFSAQHYAIKVRADLHNNCVLQVRIYQNHDHTDYAYQLFRGDKPLQRWDNKEHFPHLASYPHHHHTSDGLVIKSALVGDPEYDVSARCGTLV